MEPIILARIQFALTVGFHFIFPPITIGLAWLLVIIEYFGWKKNQVVYLHLGKFIGKIFAVTFAVGVATGIVMEFQFGTNWAEYSKFVGDIFGAPLAAEGLMAFFLESSFLGLYLLGRNKVSKGLHWFSILMVAVGSTISAFWIIVANSWQQTPAGYVLRNGRAELTDFYAAVFNPSTMPRFLHTIDASLTTGAFFLAAICAYMILKNNNVEIAKRGFKLAVIFGFIVSVLNLMPFGHHHVIQVAKTQPAKFAAIEGLYESQSSAPMMLFAIPETDPQNLKFKIQIPGLLSWLLYGDPNAYVTGLDKFPEDEIPPLWMTFVSFHNMVVLGMYFIGITALGVLLIIKKKLWNSRWYLKIMLYSIALPVAACELGWTTAEVGRQPWVVYGLMKTRDAVSISVGAGEILFSILLISAIYIVLFILWVKIVLKLVNKGPEPLLSEEAA